MGGALNLDEFGYTCIRRDNCQNSTVADIYIYMNKGRTRASDYSVMVETIAVPLVSICPLCGPHTSHWGLRPLNETVTVPHGNSHGFERIVTGLSESGQQLNWKEWPVNACSCSSFRARLLLFLFGLSLSPLVVTKNGNRKVSTCFLLALLFRSFLALAFVYHVDYSFPRCHPVRHQRQQHDHDLSCSWSDFLCAFGRHHG